MMPPINVYVISSVVTEKDSPLFSAVNDRVACRELEAMVDSLYKNGALHEDDDFILHRVGVYSPDSKVIMADNAKKDICRVSAISRIKQLESKAEDFAPPANAVA